jgi:hypothetical protein
MKNLILSALFLVLTISSYAQTTFTCKSRETCWWNSYTETFTQCSDVYFDNSVFIMNKNEDILVHKTSSMTSSYYVVGTEVEEDYITYSVISDVGNEYLVIFDVEKMLIKYMGVDGDGNMFLTMYGIKSVF